MTTATKDGGIAFARRDPRTTNPFDAGSEEWMCWRDGWEQAKALAERAPVPQRREEDRSPAG